MNKTLLGLVICVLAVGLLGCQGPTDFQNSLPQESAKTGGSTGSGKGEVAFIITDAAADMGSVSEVRVTVDSIQVQSTTEGWVDVSTDAMTYDLLELKADGSQALLAQAELGEGSYNEIRLDISEVVVVDSEGEHKAKLPSGELKIKGDLIVEENTTATATFDFIADESLHMTGNGEYVMSPVIQVETRSDAEIEVGSNNRVEVRGGSVRSNAKVGMDINGNVGVGLGIPATLEISIGNGKVVAGKSSGAGANASSSAKAKIGKNSSVSADGNVNVGIGSY